MSLAKFLERKQSERDSERLLRQLVISTMMDTEVRFDVFFVAVVKRSKLHPITNHREGGG